MGAKEIRPFARKAPGAGELFYGTVPAGTPVCHEEDLVSFTDRDGLQTGTLLAIPTIRDIAEKGILQAAGYAKTPNPLPAGVYVLAEIKAPSGYVRSGPVAVEIYSDRILYSVAGRKRKRQHPFMDMSRIRRGSIRRMSRIQPESTRKIPQQFWKFQKQRQ